MMADWPLRALGNGFNTDLPLRPVCWFVLFVAVSCLIKFAWDFGTGGWRRLEHGSFLAHSFGTDLKLPVLLVNWYPAVIVIRPISAVLLLLGPYPRFAAIALVVRLVYELGYEYRSHTIYLSLLCGATACMASLPSNVATCALSGYNPLVKGNTYACFLIVLFTVQMYLSSAYRKLRSPTFMSGQRLYIYVWALAQGRARDEPREAWLPRTLLNRHERLHWRGGWLTVWKSSSWLVVAVEAALPVLLVAPPLWPVAVVLGVGMHFAFLLLMPRRLVPFSLATVSSYLIFGIYRF